MRFSAAVDIDFRPPMTDAAVMAAGRENCDCGTTTRK